MDAARELLAPPADIRAKRLLRELPDWEHLERGAYTFQGLELEENGDLVATWTIRFDYRLHIHFPHDYPFHGMRYSVEVIRISSTYHEGLCGLHDGAGAVLPRDVRARIGHFLRETSRMSFKEFIYTKHLHQGLSSVEAAMYLQHCTRHLAPHCWSPGLTLRKQWPALTRALDAALLPVDKQFVA